MSQREFPIKAVDGIILLHPINRNRMSEASVALGTLRKAFSKVLDTDLESRYPFFRVALATTLWVAEVTGGAATKAAIEKERTKQIRRECDLQDNWWRLLEVQGAMFRRHDNDLYESAKDIVLSVIKAQIPEQKTVYIRDQLIVGIIGSTQAGKSSFVEALTETSPSSKGNELRMESIEPYEIEINKEKVVLLDTPGLDATENPTDVFQMIAGWLKAQGRKTARTRHYLDGIVVVHPILSNEQFGELVLQSVLIEQANKLLGKLKKVYDVKDPRAYCRVILATTKWDKVSQDEKKIAEEKEENIRRTNWNIMSVAGSPVMRFDNTAESAQRIIKTIVDEKKSADAIYQYRNIRAALNDISSGFGHMQEEFSELKKARTAMSRGLR
ncbi:hypothetical protein AGABI1DRAFT_116385 [Agaricus bisporus var. burnettii JB137-S8]|uniref:G domain-containing protein n=1 Tax=Agaricus bisporus var. burnettii (strain JB137-S8 / ATCC MYA-4627 / FGSC 10392) TaxID=597362 RepID=K5WXA9_AGABU|nr:uncharacterized protein AGABI1DRAFT_116385 [Agaricus bisporus var. burnettii JB137-S8]EKM75458.1 hypothetical protein AGABI1DRAFT_116385 [Agaricus bisporus var. burnettii JB137-S8]